MTMPLFHAFWTLVVLLIFIGIILWAFSKNRRSDFEEAARLPLEDQPPLDQHAQHSERPHV